MIMMGGKKDGSTVAMIMKKIGQKYDTKEPMECEKEEKEEKMQEVPNENGAESDYKDGMNNEVDKMMSAFESKDKDSFKTALKSFIKMAMKED